MQKLSHYFILLYGLFSPAIRHWGWGEGVHQVLTMSNFAQDQGT
jgi:hypothetical protein